MTPEEQIVDCIEEYPLIFQHRGDVLEHWFFVLGNGYWWENGELVTHDDKREKDFSEWEQHVASGAAWRAQWLGPMRTLYPVSSYAGYICNSIPDDITPEWAALIKEATFYRAIMTIRGAKGSQELSNTETRAYLQEQADQRKSMIP